MTALLLCFPASQARGGWAGEVGEESGLFLQLLPFDGDGLPTWERKEEKEKKKKEATSGVPFRRFTA